MINKSVPTRFRLTLEYDGTRYSGWQKQDEARTLQGSLLQAAAALFGSAKVDIQGSGRTDAGVHALNYTAHLEVRTDLSPDAILNSMNDALPRDIVLLRVEKAHARFHARHNCIARSYIYRLSKRKSAFERKYVWWVREPLDLEAMRRAAGLLTGMHDFVSFAEKQELKKSTMVLVQFVELTEDNGLIVFRIIGSHFLWKMVRRIVGILVEVGRHSLAVEDVRGFLTEKSDRPFRYIAPAAGLFFERAFYHEQELQKFLHHRDEV
ncbi:MAG: tRNA pseudouridine(38-40) synthase TruA [bacterium]